MDDMETALEEEAQAEDAEERIEEMAAVTEEE